jgi:very-short-patch-repair endonuclease
VAEWHSGSLRTDRSRLFRRSGTDAATALWQLLRVRRLGGAKFRRQHPVGPYVLDFYCPAARLAIEVDGGQHFAPEGRAQDAVRTDYLKARRIRVLRFTDREALLEREGVIATIERELGATRLAGPPSPSPSPPGRGN